MGGFVPKKSDHQAGAKDPSADAPPKKDGAMNLAQISATAGALAGCVARFVVGPLDVIKIRFQVQLEPISIGGPSPSKYTSLRQAFVTIVKEEGIQVRLAAHKLASSSPALAPAPPGLNKHLLILLLQALWRGTLPGQLLTIPYTAVQFVMLQQCKKVAEAHGLGKHGATAFVNGALAGAAGTLASYPFDLLRTTLAAQGEPKVYRGMSDAAQGIVKTQGVRGLYRGVGVTMLEIMPYAALQFGLYEAFLGLAEKARLERAQATGQHLSKHTAWESFFCGLAAGTLAKLGTHPLDVAKKRFQVAGLQRSARYGQRVAASTATSLAACIKEIAVNEGIAGFYKGALPSLLKAAPSAAVTFACYDFFFRLLAARAARKAADALPNNV